MIAIARCACLEACGVRSRTRLGEAIAREMLHAAKLREETAGVARHCRNASIIHAAMLWIEM